MKPRHEHLPWNSTSCSAHVLLPNPKKYRNVPVLVLMQIFSCPSLLFFSDFLCSPLHRSLQSSQTLRRQYNHCAQSPKVQTLEESLWPPKKVKSMKHISLTFPSLVKNHVVCVLFTCCPSKGPFSLTVWCPPICIAPLNEGCVSSCINPYLLVTQNVNWTFTLLLKRGRKKSWFDSRHSFCFKWTMKIETTDNFFHSQFPKHRRLTPRVHPIHRPPHAQGLAVLLMITDCKIKLVECGSCPWSHRPFICSAFFFPLCEATDQCKPCSLLQPTPPTPAGGHQILFQVVGGSCKSSHML